MNILNKQKWIWQNSNFPNFTYLKHDLKEIYYKFGQINILESSTNQNKTQNFYKELQGSYLLEEETLKKNTNELEMFLKSFEDTKTFFTDNTFFSLNSWFLSSKDKNYRKDNQEIEIVSGFNKEETIHYQAPLGKDVKKLMKDFLSWLNKEDNDNKVDKALIASLYFLLIQPFNENNEKISRVLFFDILRKEFNISFFPYSSFLLEEKSKYNQIIDEICSSKDMNINKYISFMLESLDKALLSYIKELRNQNKANKETSFWEKHFNLNINARQKKLILKNLTNKENGKRSKEIRVFEYMELTQASRLTANRDLQDLVKKNIFTNYGKGRGSFYKFNS